MSTIERIANVTHGKSHINGVLGTNSESQNPTKPPEMPALPTIPDNDADIALIHSNPLRGRLADIQGDLRRNGTLSSTFQNYRQLLALLMEKREQMREQIKILAQLESKKKGKMAQQKAVWKKIETFKQQIDDIANGAHFNGNKLFTAEGQDMAISIGHDVVINLPAKNFGVSLTDVDLSAEPEMLFKETKRQIQAILDYDGFLIGVEKKLESARTMMAFELRDILEVEKHMAKTNLTLEVAKYTLARVMENMRQALRGQAHVSPAEAATLLINGN